MARPSRARLTPVRRSTGSRLQAASYSVTFSTNSPGRAHVVAELQGDLAVTGLVPALAGHVELQLERHVVVAGPGRRSRSRSARRPRAPAPRRRRSRASGRGPGRGRSAGPGSRRRVRPSPGVAAGPRGRQPLLGRLADEPVVSGEVTGREELPQPLLPGVVGIADRTRAGDPPADTITVSRAAWRSAARRTSRGSRAATAAASHRLASRRARPEDEVERAGWWERR